METLSPDQRGLLLSLMHHGRLTACYELLQPGYQHVVDINHLREPKLKFIAWTTQYGQSGGEAGLSYTAIPPHVALDLAGCIGLDAVSYTVVGAEKAEEHMAGVRKETGHEGEVTS